MFNLREKNIKSGDFGKAENIKLSFNKININNSDKAESKKNVIEFNDKLDEVITSAFEIKEEPKVWLNQNIVRRAKGDNIFMKKSFFKTVPVVAALAVGVLGVGSISSYAAWKYLSTEQVAQKVDNKKLADAFKGEDVVNINQSQTYGDYKITLLGIVSGKNLSDYVTSHNGEVQDDKSYAAIAIEKKDGSAMTEKERSDSSFLVSPYIKGENPIHCNIYYMGGGSTSFIEDGVVYRIIDCDNVEAFAKRGVYLGVSSGTFYDRDAYNFDKKTGEISRNERYNGVNALFDLPLDASKGDENAAKELLERWKAMAEDDDISASIEKEGAVGAEDSEVTINKFLTDGDDALKQDIDFRNEMGEWDVNKIKEKAELIKGSVKKLKPDENGNVTYKLKTGVEIPINVKELFWTDRNRKDGVCNNSSLDSDGYMNYYVFELEKDGTVKGSGYRVKVEK